MVFNGVYFYFVNKLFLVSRYWDFKMNVNEILKCGFRRVENIVGKGENAGKQHFLLSHNVCKSPLFQGH